MVAAELPGLIVPALPIVRLATNTSQQPPRCNSQARSLIQQLWNGVRFALLVIQVSSYLIYRPLLSNLRIFARRCLVVVTALCRPRFACPAVKWKKKNVDRTKQWRLRPNNSFNIAHVRASFYRAGFALFCAFQIPWLFLVFHDLKFSCHFRKSSLFSGILWHNLPVFYFVLANRHLQ